MNRDVLIKQLTVDEGLRLKPYKDSLGVLTIGIGRNLDDVGISEAEALVMLNNDLDRTEADLDRALPWWRFMTESRRSALCNMAFNIGIGNSTRGLLSFRNTLAAMQSGDYKKAADGMRNSTWARQVGARAERLAKMMEVG